MRAEHLKLFLQDLDAVDLLTEAATRVARAQVPTDVAEGLARTRLTALQKADGGVRGIATGDAFRRLVSRTLAKEWAGNFDRATRPYQFALQARAGTDALAAHVRAALALRPDAVLVSLDGRNAYDCMSRAAFLTKLHEVAPELLPFVRVFYGRPSTYSWWDDQGRCREVKQGEGCEQGDPLAPALFALGQHDALHRAASTLHPDESLGMIGYDAASGNSRFARLKVADLLAGCRWSPTCRHWFGECPAFSQLACLGSLTCR